MRLFEARAVRPPEAPAPGELRPAAEHDLRTVEEWAIAFHEEAGTGTPVDPVRGTREQVAEQRLFVWDHGGPVSMAVSGRRIERSVHINIVYTPREYRRQGYASACVAALTQQFLSSGVAFCCINADVTNPTTNKIYPAIGYRSVCELSNIDLNAG
jgi:hypothetical protein